jgi:hypothetical protein
MSLKKKTPKKKTNPEDPDPCPPIQYFSKTIKQEEDISSDEDALIFTPKKKTNPEDPDPCPPRPLSIQYFSMTIKKGNKSETSTSNIIPSIFTPEKKTDIQDMSMSIQDYIHKIEEEKKSGAENSIFTPEKKTDEEISSDEYALIFTPKKKTYPEDPDPCPLRPLSIQYFSMTIKKEMNPKRQRETIPLFEIPGHNPDPHC